MHRVLIVGCGNMGKSHAKAYHEFTNCEIVGLVSRGKSNADLNTQLKSKYPEYSDFDLALKNSKPDVVCISSYTETHAEFALKSFEAGAHVFLEKPLAADIEKANEIVAAAEKFNKKLVVGYILRVHPAWKKFISIGRDMDPPYVMRLNLNQQSYGDMWVVHKNLMRSTSPLVDCGVHYVDVMCQVTDSKPVSVSASGARLSDEIAEDMYNYGHLQVQFEDGSFGWYESGWGPMVSETAFFVKDIVGKKGAVSMVEKQGASSDIGEHTNTQQLKVHHAYEGEKGRDEFISSEGEPDHDALCKLEQEVLLDAIEHDIDLSASNKAAIDSLAIVLAADESIKTGKTIKL